MNFFESELRRMFGDAENISDAVFVGRTMLGKLDDELRVKAQFISTHIAKHYDAIQISILNRTDGVVDKETMIFGDIIGQKMTRCSDKVNPDMWEENVGKACGTHRCLSLKKHRYRMRCLTMSKCFRRTILPCSLSKGG